MCPLGGHVSAFIYQFRFQRLNTASDIFPSPPRSRGGLFQILLESRQNFTGSLLVIKKIMAAPQPYLPRTVALLVISWKNSYWKNFLDETCIWIPSPVQEQFQDRLCFVFSDGTKDRRNQAWQNQGGGLGVGALANLILGTSHACMVDLAFQASVQPSHLPCFNHSHLSFFLPVCFQSSRVFCGQYSAVYKEKQQIFRVSQILCEIYF